MMKFIDLSVPLGENTPIYPGDPAIKIEPGGILGKDGYEDHYISIGTHVGTHIDGPRHMIVGGKTLDQFPIETFVGRGIYVKVADKKFDLGVVKKVDIKEGDIVLFHTGMNDIYNEEKYFTSFPVMTEEIAEYLVNKKVKMVGVDTCSVDSHLTSFPMHKILLKSDVLIIENLTNLDQLSRKEFRVYALPLNFSLDGSPARVIAASG